MVTTAIILCGGMGTRMGALTKTTPKALLRVREMPLIWYSISFLQSYGIKKFVLPLGFQGNKIRKYVESAFASKDLNFDFIDTGADAPIHARISAVMPSIKGEENVVLLNSDTIFDFDLQEMFNIHSNNDWDITLSTVPVTSPWGTVTIDGNALTGFQREAIFRDVGLTTNGHARGKIYSGLSVINMRALNKFDWADCTDFETVFFNWRIKNGKCGIFQVEGLWLPIDTPKQLEAINNGVATNVADMRAIFSQRAKPV